MNVVSRPFVNYMVHFLFHRRMIDIVTLTFDLVTPSLVRELLEVGSYTSILDFYVRQLYRQVLLRARIRLLAMGILSVRPSVWGVTTRY